MYKVVIIMGSGHFPEHVKSVKDLVYKYGTDKVVLLGNGKDKISEVMKTGFSYLNNTDEETLFIIDAHGGIKGGVHYIDDLPTKTVLRNIQLRVKHPITVYQDSCYAGKLLKGSEISKNISLLSRSASKYLNLYWHGSVAIKDIINKKLSSSLNNEEIFSLTLRSSPETFYYLPPEDRRTEEKKESKSYPVRLFDKVKSKDEIRKYKSIGIRKFSRPGKFTLQEIENILKQVYKDTSGSKQVIEMLCAEFERTEKQDFSLSRIKKILNIENDQKTGVISSKLLSAFREALKIKLSKTGLEAYLNQRSKEFDKIAKIDSSAVFVNNDDLINDFWSIVTSRGYSEEAQAMIDNHPYLVNYALQGKYTALNDAVHYNHVQLTKTLVKNGAAGLEEALTIAKARSNEELRKFLQNTIKSVIKTNLESRGDKNLSLDNMKAIIDLVRIVRTENVTTPVSHYCDTIDDPRKSRPLLSRLLLHCNDKEVVQMLNDNLNSFITGENLTQKDYKHRLPLTVAIERASASAGKESHDLFIQIAAKIAVKMKLNSKEDLVKYCVDKEGKEYKGRDLRKLESTLKDIVAEIAELNQGTKIAGADFETKDKKEAKRAGVLPPKPSTATTKEQVKPLSSNNPQEKQSAK